MGRSTASQQLTQAPEANGATVCLASILAVATAAPAFHPSHDRCTGRDHCSESVMTTTECWAYLGRGGPTGEGNTKPCCAGSTPPRHSSEAGEMLGHLCAVPWPNKTPTAGPRRTAATRPIWGRAWQCGSKIAVKDQAIKTNATLRPPCFALLAPIPQPRPAASQAACNT